MNSNKNSNKNKNKNKLNLVVKRKQKQLEAAIQVLAAAAAAPPAAGPPLPLPTHVSIYQGDTLDFRLHTRMALFHHGCAVLTSNFTGKVEALHMFLADLHNQAQTC